MNSRIRKWLHNRKISDDIIKEANLQYKNGSIVIPVHDTEGNHLFNKYRRDPQKESGPKYRYDKGASAKLYSYSRYKNEDKLLLCEGELDALTLQSLGVPAVTSTGGSGTFKDEWVELLDDKDVIIVYDYDEAGITGAHNAHKKLSNSKIAWLPKHNDVTDFIQAESHLDFLEDAREYPTDIGSAKAARKAAQVMIDERHELEEEALPGLPRDEHTHILQEHYNEVAKDLKEDKKSSGLSEVKPERKNRLEAAKKVPIENFVDFNRSGFATSVWNPDEEDPSMKYYPEENRVYDFSTSQGGDVVDVVMAKHNVDFNEALNIILK